MTLPPEGRLLQHSLSSLLGRLGVVRATGLLDLTYKKLVRRVVLEGGRIQSLLVNAREDRFFDWLQGRKELAALDPKLVSECEKLIAGQPLTAGVLLQKNLLRPDQLTVKLREYLAALLTESAGWADAQFAIRPGRVPLGAEPVAAWPAVEAALVLARSELTKLRRPPTFPAELAAVEGIEIAGPLELLPAEDGLLGLAIQGARLDELRTNLAFHGGDAVEAALGTFWQAGLLGAVKLPEVAEQEGPVTAAELDRWLKSAAVEDLNSVLGVGPNPDPATVRRAYYRAVRRFHPDRFRGGDLSHRHREIEQAFRVVHEALRVLTDPQARAEFDERRQRLAQATQIAQGAGAAPAGREQQAQSRLMLAQKAMAAGRRVDALTLLEQAVKMAPDDPSYLLPLALLLIGNPARRKDALDLLGKMTRDNPRRADILAAYALALARSGRGPDSVVERGRALLLDPTLPLARALAGDEAALAQVNQDPFLAPLFRVGS